MTALHHSSLSLDPSMSVVVVDAALTDLTAEWARDGAARAVASSAVGAVLHLAERESTPAEACGPEAVAAVASFLVACDRAGLRTAVVAVDEALRRCLVAGGIDDIAPVLYWLEDAVAVAGAAPGWR